MELLRGVPGERKNSYNVDLLTFNSKKTIFIYRRR